ncbi:MAG: N-acetyltransferase [Anaerolineaceae bacterium]|nr:N-acetyltransferase [Anaerolineaceae bacterium]
MTRYSSIRPETPADVVAIYAVNKQAFAGRQAEPGLVDAIRTSAGFIPQLSLVAEQNGAIVGHILFSRTHIQTDNSLLPALALAPLAVLPEYQRQGIGSAPVRRGLQECRRLGQAVVIVLGCASYYPRFGFSAGLAKALECPLETPNDPAALQMRKFLRRYKRITSEAQAIFKLKRVR